MPRGEHSERWVAEAAGWWGGEVATRFAAVRCVGVPSAVANRNFRTFSPHAILAQRPRPSGISRAVVYTIKSIKKGEELVFDYGWEPMGRRPLNKVGRLTLQ